MCVCFFFDPFAALQVAVQHALDSIPPVLSGKADTHPYHGCGGRSQWAGTSAGAAAAAAGTTTATFTVRTAFGSAAGRGDGLLGWLRQDRSDRRRDDDDDCNLRRHHHHLESVGDTSPAAAAAAAVAGAAGLTPLRTPTPAPMEASRCRRRWWIGDRTTPEARILMIARRPESAGCPSPSDPRSVGNATVLAGLGVADAAVVAPEAPAAVGVEDLGDKRLALGLGAREGLGDGGGGGPTLAFVRKFAICTEVVILGPAWPRPAKRAAQVTTPAAAPPVLAPRESAAASSAREGGSNGWCSEAPNKCKDRATPAPTPAPTPHVGPKEKDETKPARSPEVSRTCATPREMMRVVDGVRVLLRSYLVVDVADMSVLPRVGSMTRGVGSVAEARAGGSANRSRRGEKAERGRKHHADPDAGGRAGLTPEQGQRGSPPSTLRGEARVFGEGGGCEPATRPGSAAADGRGGSTLTSTTSLQPVYRQQLQQQPRGQSKPPSPQQIISVSEALVVRLAGNGVSAPASSSAVSSGRGGGGGGKGKGKGKGKGRSWGGGVGRGGGPKLDASHERESVTVRGFLKEVGFRVLADGNGGGDRERRGVAASAGSMAEGKNNDKGKGKGKSGECVESYGGRFRGKG